MSRVLLIGPERRRASGVRSLLKQEGHQVVWLRSVDRWRLHEREVQPEIVVATVAAPDGILSRQPLRPLAGFPAPLLFVQQEGDFLGDPHTEERLIDRLSSPFMGPDLSGRVDALIRVRRVIRRQPVADRPNFDDRSGSKLGGLSRKLASWVNPEDLGSATLQGPYVEVAARVADWADRRDAFEPGHAARVSGFCAMIAEALKLEERETSGLLRAAMLHDIGKVALPVEMLHQKKPLAETQMRLIRTHPAKGAALLRALDPDDHAAQVVLCHHERPDGSGYYGKHPDGVPRAAYVLSVAEEFDAMTSSQVREPLSSSRALEVLEEGKGHRYDPYCVEALVDSLRPRSSAIQLSSSWHGDIVPLEHGPRSER